VGFIVNLSRKGARLKDKLSKKGNSYGAEGIETRVAKQTPGCA
jgi:hypothetical protein